MLALLTSISFPAILFLIKMENIKKILFRFGAVVVGCMFFIFIAEAFFRINPKFGYAYSFFKYKTEYPLKGSSYIRPSAIFGYECIPNAKPEINLYGLIGKQYPLKKEPGTFRILVIGDSIAYCGWASEFLESNLNNNPELKSHYKYQLWTCGVPGYDVRRYALFLKHQGSAIKPDMVIVFLFMNDFELNTSLFYKDKNGDTAYHFPIDDLYQKGYIISPSLMKLSYFYRYIVLNLNNYYARHKSMPRNTPRNVYNGLQYMGQIKDMCAQSNIPLLVVIFPYLKPNEEYLSYQKREYEAIRNVAQELKLDSIDLHSFYDKLLKEGFNLRLEDDIHPNKEAHQLIAREIYGHILAKPKIIGVFR